MQNKKTVEENLISIISKIGEKITLRRSDYIESGQFINFSYTHLTVKKNLGKIGVLVGLQSSADKNHLLEIGKQIAMHIAATKPLAKSINELDKYIDYNFRDNYTPKNDKYDFILLFFDFMIEVKIKY